MRLNFRTIDITNLGSIANCGSHGQLVNMKRRLTVLLAFHSIHKYAILLLILGKLILEY